LSDVTHCCFFGVVPQVEAIFSVSFILGFDLNRFISAAEAAMSQEVAQQKQQSLTHDEVAERVKEFREWIANQPQLPQNLGEFWCCKK